MSRISGFIGVESYDLIIYLTKILKLLNASVLLIDDSDDKSLLYAIPGLGSNSIAEFEGATAIASGNDANLVCLHDYDFVFIYTGKKKSTLLEKCDELFLVTDFQRHNIEFLKTINTATDTYLFLVVRDRITTKITADYIKYELKSLQISDDAVIELEDTETDLGNKVLLQHNSVKVTKKFSSSITDFLQTVLASDFNEKEIKNALKRLRR